MLNTLTSEASACCERYSAKIDLAVVDAFTCARCGCEYRPRLEGALRYWDYFGAISVIHAARRA
jgi:hypothetical protein